MNTRNFVLAAAISAGFLAMNLAAQDASTTIVIPKLSPAAEQIVQLTQAKVSDDTIIAYIQNSGNNYILDANQIIYLKQQGVSTVVINTMLNQRSTITGTAAQTATQPVDSNSSSAQTSTAVAQPTVTYVQSVPTSSVYVIPDTQTYNYDAYYYQPYYYPTYGYYYPYPAVSLSFGIGGRLGGGFHGGGGFRGGGFHAGGWHR